MPYQVAEPSAGRDRRMSSKRDDTESLMLFNVKVVSESEYQDYIQSLRAKGQEGQLSSEYDRNQNLPGTGAPQLKEEE